MVFCGKSINLNRLCCVVSLCDKHEDQVPRLEWSKAGQGRAVPARAGPGQPGQGRAYQGKAGHGRARQDRAGQDRASRAGQG